MFCGYVWRGVSGCFAYITHSIASQMMNDEMRVWNDEALVYDGTSYTRAVFCLFQESPYIERGIVVEADLWLYARAGVKMDMDEKWNDVMHSTVWMHRWRGVMMDDVLYITHRMLGRNANTDRARVMLCIDLANIGRHTSSLMNVRCLVALSFGDVRQFVK